MQPNSKKPAVSDHCTPLTYILLITFYCTYFYHVFTYPSLHLIFYYVYT